MIILSADVWRKRCGGMERDDNVAWSRPPSSHIEKCCVESRSVFEVIGMCIFPFWLSVLLGPVLPSYFHRLPQRGWQTSSSVVTTCVCVCFSVRFHKRTLHLHITQESKGQAEAFHSLVDHFTDISKSESTKGLIGLPFHSLFSAVNYIHISISVSITWQSDFKIIKRHSRY